MTDTSATTTAGPSALAGSNPIFAGFFPDPSTIVVDGRFYIAHSSFEWFPVVPIHSSLDLQHWAYAGALAPDSTVDWDLRGLADSDGVWAPSISHDGSRFWIVVSIVRSNTAGEKNLETVVSTAEHVAGPWSPPVRVPGTGFDPALFHDAGRLWLVNMAWDNAPAADRFAGITLIELDPLTLSPLGSPQLILHTGTLVEGPNLYRTDDGYLLTVAEGGTGWNHGITAFRADTLTGPWRGDPNGSFLTTRDTPGHPIQKAGHGEIVKASSGEEYVVHLGSRVALQSGERRALLGRETFVQDLAWEEGWPRLANRTRLPASSFNLPAGTSLNADDGGAISMQLDTKWPWGGLRRGAERFAERLAPGTVQLRGGGTMTSQYEVSVLGRRVQAAEHAYEVRIDAAPAGPWHAAGIALYYDTRNYFHLQITAAAVGRRKLSLVVRDAGSAPRELLSDDAACLRGTGPVLFRVDTTNLLTQFSVDTGDGWRQIGAPLPFLTLSDDHDTTLQFTGPMFAITATDTLSGTWSATFQSGTGQRD